MKKREPRILPAGDDGLLIEFEEIEISRLHALALILRGRPDIEACIVAHSSVLILGRSPDVVASLRDSLAMAIDAATTMADGGRIGSAIEIGVDFSDEFAPDLPELVKASGLSREEIIERLTSVVFSARYLGFLPGFAYLEGLPDEFALPRRTVPRGNVPAGTFAIAGNMAGFYSEDSPGGWNLLGRTDVRLWNPRKEPPNSITPGDDLRIVDATGMLHFMRPDLREPALVGDPIAEVLQPGLLTRVVGPALYERYSYGVAAGGPFDRELAALANLAVGNPPDATVLECAAVGPGLRFARPSMVAAYGACVSPLVNGRKASQHGIQVEVGDLLTFGRIADGFRVAIAIDGGIEDSRAKYAPRPLRLRKGDVIHCKGHETAARKLRPVRRTDPKVIRVMVGPHPVEPEALEFVLAAQWVVTPQLNRMGLRMKCGETLHEPPPADLLSCGVRFGSVQWLPGGDLILMGPDHPVTGGYLQPITVVSKELWKIGQLAPGDKVRFVA